MAKPRPSQYRKSLLPALGAWSFYAVIGFCILFGFVNAPFSSTALVLGLVGVLVGLLNITNKETLGFLIAGIALNSGAGGLIVVLDSVSVGALSASVLGAILGNLTIFISPAIGIVALKALYGYAQYGD